MLAYAGDAEAGERALAPFRALATPLADMVKPQPYPEMYPPDDDDVPPDRRSRGRCSSTGRRGRRPRRSSSTSRRSDAPMRVAQLRVLGGAMARVPADATAFAHRTSRIMVNVARSTRARTTSRSARRGSPSSRRPSTRATRRLRQLPRRRGRGPRPRGLSRDRPGTGSRRSRAATTRPTSSGCNQNIPPA